MFMFISTFSSLLSSHFCLEKLSAQGNFSYCSPLFLFVSLISMDCIPAACVLAFGVKVNMFWLVSERFGIKDCFSYSI